METTSITLQTFPFVLYSLNRTLTSSKVGCTSEIKIKNVLFCTSLDFHYLWLRPRYSRSEKQKKICFFLVFLSLNRTFAIVLTIQMKMRRIIYILAWLGTVGLLGSCGQTDKVKTDDDSTALKLGVLPTVDCLPFYYADSIGLFDSLGISMKLVTFDAAMDADTAFVNGTVDGVVSDLVKTCIWQGQGDTAMVAMVGELRMWLITSPRARLLKAESLKEKIIGITRHSAVDFFADKIMESVKLQSIDLNKPQINNIRLRGQMVDQDQYDGAILPEPFASEAVARGAKRLDGTESLGLQRLMCVLFNDSVYKTRQPEIDKVRKAYDLAVKALNADSLTNVLNFIPEAHRVYLPDTLYIYKPLNTSITYDDSMLVEVRKWAQGRGLIKTKK